MAKRFYDTGLPDQLWYQKLTPKCKALYLHLLCKCDVAGTFEINYPMFSAYIGENITEDDLFSSFGNRVIPLIGKNDKGILVDFVYFQCGGELNPNVKVHQAIFKRLDELDITVEFLQKVCTHELKVYTGSPKYLSAIEKKTEQVQENNEGEQEQKPRKVKVNKQDDTLELFNEFYTEYPRHDSKQVAILKFAKIMRECKDSDERRKLLDKMLHSIRISKASEQWMKEGGRFIPMPSTWLNQKRWEDEGLVAEPKSDGHDQLASALVSALKF